MYKNKYLKYKNKYLELKSNLELKNNLSGGAVAKERTSIEDLQRKISEHQKTIEFFKKEVKSPVIETEIAKLESQISEFKRMITVMEEENQLQQILKQSEEEHLRKREASRLSELEKPKNLEYWERAKRILTYDLKAPREIDYAYHVKEFIEFLQKMIESNKKYNLYLSIGSNCGIDSQYSTENCIINQNSPPKGFHNDDGELIILIIDKFNRKELELNRAKINPTFKDNTFFFNMYWLDDYKPLIDSLGQFLDYNTKNNGKSLCVNFAKFDKHQNQSPIFINLIKLFYIDDMQNFRQTSEHYNQIVKYRRMYLDWTYYNSINTSDDRDASLVLYFPDNILYFDGVNSPKQQLIRISQLNEPNDLLNIYFSAQNIEFDF